MPVVVHKKSITHSEGLLLGSGSAIKFVLGLVTKIGLTKLLSQPYSKMQIQKTCMFSQLP